MDVHLRNLRYFVAVSEELHFSRAAQRLHVSQPALSKQIRQLERELRFPLFRRDRRRVEPTAAGAALLAPARRLLDQWEEALVEAARRASEEAALLRVGFQTSVYGGLYQDVAARFRELRPSWRLELRSYQWSDPSAGLLDGSADVAFVWLPVPEIGRLEVHVLRREACHVAMPGRHRLAGRRAVTMADLLDEPFVALPPEAGVQRDFWLAVDARGGRPARIGAEAGTPDETFEAVATGRGVVLLSEGNARLYARAGIVSLPVEGLSPCVLAVACRRGDDRREVAELVQAAVAVEAAAAPSRAR